MMQQLKEKRATSSANSVNKEKKVQQVFGVSEYLA